VRFTDAALLQRFAVQRDVEVLVRSSPALMRSFVTSEVIFSTAYVP
jgi:hypothetical protein